MGSNPCKARWGEAMEFFSGFAFLTASVAVITTVCMCNAFAERATASAEAMIVEPVTVGGDLEIWTTSSFVSGMIGDLVIRIPAAGLITATIQDESAEPIISSSHAELSTNNLEYVISAWQTQRLTDCAGATCGSETATGMLAGNPVSNINISTSDASPTNPTSINVIITYN